VPNNEHLTGHHNPWRTVEHARQWIARMDREPRDRREELGLLVALLPFEPQAPIGVLELGAGHGALTTTLLERFPRARVLALDLSPVMIKEGQQRLKRFGDRVRFLQWDLEQPGWPAEIEGPFDAVVSSLAIHHLNRARKAELARQLYARLRPGGVVLNLDYVSPASESLRRRYEQAQPALEAHYDQAGHGPNLAGSHATDPLFDQLDDLRQAGFQDVDVFWKRLGVALFGGTRSA
jgi:tRNA (cmo5U34)-methyltransferase